MPAKKGRPPGAKTQNRRTGKRSLTVWLTDEQIDRLDREADERIVGRGKLVDLALDLLFEYLDENPPLPRRSS